MAQEVSPRRQPHGSRARDTLGRVFADGGALPPLGARRSELRFCYSSEAAATTETTLVWRA